MDNTYVLTGFIAGSIFIQIFLLLGIHYLMDMDEKWPFMKSATRKTKLLWIEMAAILETIPTGWFFPAIFWPMMIPNLTAWFLLWYTNFEKTFLPIKYLNPN